MIIEKRYLWRKITKNGTRLSCEGIGTCHCVEGRVPRAILQFINKRFCGYNIPAQDAYSRSRIGSSAVSYSECLGLKSCPEYRKSLLRF